MFKFKFVGVLLVLCSGLAISASAFAGPVYGVLNMGLDFGGDKMIEIGFDNGDTNKVTAGEGLYFAGGLGVSSGDGKYDGQVTLGWKYRGVSATNGDLDWTRYPLEALGYLNTNKIRLGGGVAYHLNPTLKGSGVLDGLEAKFDDALGFILEAQYRFNDSMLAGARMTMIDYKIEGESIKGDSFGMNLTFQFGK